MRKLILAMAFVALVATASGYDLHTKALTPVRENATPKGAPIVLVKGGACRCAIAWDIGCEPLSDCGPYKRASASIGPALGILTNAFAHVFGAVPDVIDAKDPVAVAQSRQALGARHELRQLPFIAGKQDREGGQRHRFRYHGGNGFERLRIRHDQTGR